MNYRSKIFINRILTNDARISETRKFPRTSDSVARVNLNFFMVFHGFNSVTMIIKASFLVTIAPKVSVKISFDV